MTTVRLTILGQPASKSNRRKLVTFGRGEKKRPALIKSDEAREYERAAILQIPSTARLMLEGPLRMTIHIYYASERSDLDESVVLDVLQAEFSPVKDGPRRLLRAGVYKNDRQVRERHVYHRIDPINPRAEIEVEEMQPQAAALFGELPIPVAPPKPKRRTRAIAAPSLDQLPPDVVPF